MSKHNPKAEKMMKEGQHHMEIGKKMMMKAKEMERMMKKK